MLEAKSTMIQQEYSTSMYCVQNMEG